MSRPPARARGPGPLSRIPTRSLPMTRPNAARCAFATALIVFSAARASAQGGPPDAHAAQPERPTVATHAGTVAPGWAEIEAGIEWDRYADASHGGVAPILL